MSENDKPQPNNQYVPPENGMGERIREKRKALDLSVEELAALTALYDFGNPVEQERGLSISSLYLYEKGDRKPGAREIRLLCEALNVSPNWLLLGEEWNSRQGEDSSLAEALRNLVEQASNKSVTKKLLDKGLQRDQSHAMKLTEVKMRKIR